MAVMPSSRRETRTWVRTLPPSYMVYPDLFSERLKYYLWRVLGPMHPYARNVLAAFGYMRKYDRYRPEGRQRFLIGMLAPGVTVQELVSHLVERGYGKYFVALKDRDEVVGLRYCPDFAHQYHVRIFKDGEVRGHYEYTTECHPFLHDKEVGFEERREEFLELLGDKIIPSPQQ